MGASSVAQWPARCNDLLGRRLVVVGGGAGSDGKVSSKAELAHGKCASTRRSARS
jgi:hypothetical protein